MYLKVALIVVAILRISLLHSQSIPTPDVYFQLNGDSYRFDYAALKPPLNADSTLYFYPQKVPNGDSKQTSIPKRLNDGLSPFRFFGQLPFSKIEYYIGHEVPSVLYGLRDARLVNYTVGGWFYLKNNSNGVVENIFGGYGEANSVGLQILDGQISLNRSVEQSSNGVVNLGQDFSILDEGWYFVAMVKREFSTNIYLGVVASGGVGYTFNCKSLPYGSDKTSRVSSWNVGGPTTTLNQTTTYNTKDLSVLGADCLMVWKTSLNKNEIYNLFVCSIGKQPNTCWGGKGSIVAKVAADSVVQVTTKSKNEGAEDSIEVYPNPTSGPVSLVINLKKSSPVFLQVIDLVGNILLNQAMDLSEGTNELSLNLKANAGCTCDGSSGQMVVVKVVSRNINSVSKIIIK